ncbi:Uncharacterised protein family UPF0478 [Candidatus Nanopelagicaceae bacterium]|jgi:uncharacterized protein YoxC|uniref:Unannotated protein n=1 Tax=freshwater metagenome TaxID=449393 RepID=A0A6J7TMT5_9ZZZZ|nr:DUF948 domain-containing protein [Actinomycetota bacterium]MTA60972.1 DUF948 domain-containing protein [Actinomycetota bacterium]
MGPGGIATIIAAASLFVIAIAIAYTVFRVSKFIDEAKTSLKAFTDDTTPLLNESTRTLELINGPLESFAKITKNVEEVTSKVTGATTGFMESPTGRVAGALLGAATLSKGRKSKKKSD